MFAHRQVLNGKSAKLLHQFRLPMMQNDTLLTTVTQIRLNGLRKLFKRLRRAKRVLDQWLTAEEFLARDGGAS